MFKDKKCRKFDDLTIIKLLDLLSTKTKIHTWGQIAIKQISKSDVQKQVNLPIDIFDYIYIVKYGPLFLFAGYNVQTYILDPISGNIAKSLLVFCYNKFNYSL